MDKAEFVGKRFRSWTVTDCYWSQALQAYFCLCRCDCGRTREIRQRLLVNMSTPKCVCQQKKSKRNRSKDRNGYIRITAKRIGDQFPSRVLEHVYAMEQFLGRRTNTGETIHHLNGLRDDNRIENLELWTKMHPSGQRVGDMVAFATDVLKTYAPDRLAPTTNNQPGV